MMTADEFRQTLKERGVTQQAFADEIGYSLRGVQKWAGGSAAVPKWVPRYLKHVPERDDD